MPLSVRGSRAPAFAPRFLAAFAGAFAVCTLLPYLWHYVLADTLTVGLAASQVGIWTLTAIVGGVPAFLGARRALHARRERLWSWMGALPQGGMVPGALAGVIAGVAAQLNLGGQLNSLVLSLLYDLGLRNVVHVSRFAAEAMDWSMFAAVGALAGIAAVALLYFPWTAPLPSAADASLGAAEPLGLGAGSPTFGPRVDSAERVARNRRGW